MDRLQPLLNICVILLIGIVLFWVGDVTGYYWPVAGFLVIPGALLGLTNKPKLMSERELEIGSAQGAFAVSVALGAVMGLAFVLVNLGANFFPTTPKYDFLSVFLFITGSPGAYLATIWARSA